MGFRQDRVQLFSIRTWATEPDQAGIGCLDRVLPRTATPSKNPFLSLKSRLKKAGRISGLNGSVPLGVAEPLFVGGRRSFRAPGPGSAFLSTV